MAEFLVPFLLVPIILLACIVFFDVYKGNQVKKEIEELGKNYIKITMMSSVGYLITFFLMIFNIKDLTWLETNNVILLSIMPAIVVYVFINTVYTDTLIRKVSRQFLRVAYISEYILGIYFIYSYVGDNKKWAWIMLAIYTGLILFIFFFVYSIGASDVRIIAVLAPIQICYLGTFALLITVLSFFTASVYQFYKQMKAKDKKLAVPIGPALIIPILIAIFIGPHYGLLMSF